MFQMEEAGKQVVGEQGAAEFDEGEANGYCVGSVEGGTGRGTRRLAGWDSGRLLGER